MAASVLVLQSPGCLHHDLAGNGNGLRYPDVLRAKAVVWIPPDGLLGGWYCRIGFHRVGASHVYVRHESGPWNYLYGFDDDDSAAECGEDI